jgi:DNA primase
MIDKSGINIVDVASSYTTLKAKRRGVEHAGPCPLCGGEDRFIVFEQDQRFWCRQCGINGDVIELVKTVDNVDFKAACEQLGLQLDGKPARRRPAAPRRSEPRRPKPSQLRADYAAYRPEWQDAAQRFITESMLRLWDDEHALAYLYNERRLTEGTIKAAELGWNPAERHDQWAGVDVWLPRGIVIPWNLDGNIWRIRFRGLDASYHQMSYNGMKYPQVKGSANGIYVGGRHSGVDGNTTIVLVEGEFDALAITAHAPGLLSRGLKAIATGGTTQARVSRWVDLFAQARRVLLAFDGGETAGPLAAVWWSVVLDNTERVVPLAHDVTDMVAAGYDLEAWLTGEPQPVQQTKLFEDDTTKRTHNPYELVV